MSSWLKEREFGPDHCDVATTLSNLGNACPPELGWPDMWETFLGTLLSYCAAFERVPRSPIASVVLGNHPFFL